MRIEFDKMEGAGNDFILVDNRDGKVPDAKKRNMVERYCHRRFGVGADGMVFIENDPEFDFAWDFYNSDGSSAEMCGNCARCVARFANTIGAAGDAMRFRTLAGPISARITDAGAAVQMTDVILPDGPETVQLDDGPCTLYFLNSGVPHAVVVVDDVERVDVAAQGAAIRYHPRFQPAGTNANFIQLHGGDELSIRTYERGVEAETLACGTGAVASAIVAGCFLGKHSPVTVHAKGGDLRISFSLGNGVATDVFMEGPATAICHGSFEVQ